MKTLATVTLAMMIAAGPVVASAQVTNQGPTEVIQVIPPGPPPGPVTPAPAVDANGVYQVFRTTDNQLNCEQVIAEMNQLNATIKEQTEQAARRAQGGGTGRRIGGAALGGALGGLARGTIGRNIGGLGYTGAVAAATATDAASNAIGGAVANGGGTAAAPATTSNEQQRLNRVAQLFASKGC